MLPDFLQGTYATYKKDTDAIANWLATTAKQCGYSPEVLEHERPSQLPPSKPGRLKGKARKIAKDAAAKTASDAATEAVQRIYTISIRSFTKLATHIAAYPKSGVKVPLTFSRRLDRAIDFRKKHNGWFKSVCQGEQSAANDGHAHFISVLEGVRSILQPLAATSTCPPRSSPKGPGSKQFDDAQFKNIFDNLELEEPSGEVLDAPWPTANLQPSTGVGAEVQYQAEQLARGKERVLAMFCLIRDVQDIRKHLMGIWDLYRRGKNDLHATSITTNTAIEVVRQLEEDHCKTFPENTGYFDIMFPYYVTLCRMQGQDEDKREHPDDVINMAMYDAAQSLFLPTFILLESYAQEIIPGKPSLFIRKDAKARENSQERSQMSSREKLKADEAALCEVFTGLAALAAEGLAIAEDELIRGFRELGPNKKITLWIVFALQNLLDVQQVLGSETARPFKELQNGAKCVKASIDQSIEYHQNDPLSFTWTAKEEHSLRQISNTVQLWVTEDMVKNIVQNANEGKCTPEMNESHHLLKHHPVLCGLWLFTIRYMMQQSSIKFAAKWNSIICCAHLYNAVRQKHPDICWQDMEALLQLQKSKKIFMGERPKTLEDCAKRYLLCMGLPITMFAKNRRSQNMRKSTRGIRTLANGMEVLQPFARRYAGNDRSMSVDLVAVEEKIKSLYRNPRPRILEGNLQPAEVLNYFQSWETKSKSKNRLTTLDFLDGLIVGIYNEGINLTFDYLRLHRFCHTISAELQREIGDDMNKSLVLQFSGLDEPLKLMHIVAHALGSTASLAQSTRQTQSQNAAMVKVTSCLRKMITERSGGMVSELTEKIAGYHVQRHGLIDYEACDAETADQEVSVRLETPSGGGQPVLVFDFCDGETGNGEEGAQQNGEKKFLYLG